MLVPGPPGRPDGDGPSAAPLADRWGPRDPCRPVLLDFAHRARTSHEAGRVRRGELVCEVAGFLLPDGRVAVRDSKDPMGGTLLFTRADLHAVAPRRPRGVMGARRHHRHRSRGAPVRQLVAWHAGVPARAGRLAAGPPAPVLPVRPGHREGAAGPATGALSPGAGPGSKAVPQVQESHVHVLQVHERGFPELRATVPVARQARGRWRWILPPASVNSSAFSAMPASIAATVVRPCASA